jgi:hypothetical protein
MGALDLAKQAGPWIVVARVRGFTKWQCLRI